MQNAERKTEDGQRSTQMIGRTLAHYRITDRLGAGGMGEVYLAEDTKLKRKVALKVLPSDLASDSGRLARFQREAEAVAALDHPNIVTIYSVEEADDVHFFTMERVGGEPLDRVIPPDGLDVARFLDLALPLVDAVAAAHERGITHRDLKPANVMVGADGRLRVLDFGLAKMQREDAPGELDETIEHTLEGAIVGTVPYMSPEQVQGLHVDHRSDIFSLGVMFYVMLTGRRPFEGATSAALTSSILRDNPRTVSEVRPALSGGLNRVVERCLEKSLEARYQRARDLQGDLKSIAREIESARHSQSTPAAPASEQAIAVLPFQNMSPDPENEYFSDGIAEEIINALAQIDGLRVAARTSSFSFKGKSAEIGEIGKRLNVRHVLEGSVRKSGNRVRITAQLVEASNGYQLWSERYDRQLEDIFDVQDEIARTIVARLKVALVTGRSERLVKVTTTNMEAYQLYLKGRAMLYKRGLWIARAMESFTKAVDLDPGYAQAWAGIADGNTTLSYYGFARPGETLPRALEAARKAVDADPESAEAHSALAGAALLWERDLWTAEREFLRALALNPTYTQARVWYALFFLQATGRVDEGIEEARGALDADPLSGYATGCYAYALSMGRRHSEAVVQARLALQLDPESFISRWVLANACHWSGRFDEAIQGFEAMLTASGRNVWALAGLAATYADMGRLSEARALHHELLGRRAFQYVQPVMLTISAAAIGDYEAALAFCREAADQRDSLFLLIFEVYPDFDRVRADSRIAGIAARWGESSEAPKP